MKTDIQTLKAPELLARLAAVAPSVAIETIWEHDADARWDMAPECGDPDEFTAWQSEARASGVIGGAVVSGSDYLGGTWEKYEEHPAKSNPEISGYLPQMIAEAVKELGKQVPTCHPIQKEINAAMRVLA